MASSDEEDLEALRNAALASLWKKQAEQAPQGIQVVSVQPQQNQAPPEELSYTEYEIPAEVERLFLMQRGRGRGRGRGRFQRGRGRGKEEYNTNPNVIVIPTVPMEGEQPEDKQKKDTKTFFLRPQDKWGLAESNSGSSSPKPKDTSKFRRYDDDSDSDEDFEEAKVEDVSDHELNVNDEINDSFKSADLSQSKSDCETMDQSLYETVSEVESDVYYGSGVRSVQVKEVLSQSSEIDTEHQVDPVVCAKLQIDQSDTDTKIKDDSFSSVKSETRNIQSETLAQLESSMDEKVLQKTSDALSSEADRKMEVVEDRISDNIDIPFIPEAQTMGIPVASLETSESASNISSNKFSRFNRRRRNTSGSDSDASESSDLSSWSASQSRSKFEQGLNSDNEIDAAERSKSDVSSTPMSKGSVNEQKELSDIMSSDTDSESSSSSDSSSSTPSSSTSLTEHGEIQSQNTRSSSSLKALSEPDKKSVMPTERDSRGITKDVDLRQKNDSNKLEDRVKPDLQLKERKGTHDSHKPFHEDKSESRTNRKYDLLDSDNENIKSRQYKDVKERTINQREGAKSKYHNDEHGEVRHFKQISLDNEEEMVNKMKEQTKNSFGDKSYGKDNRKGEIEQIVLDARRQKLESSENTSKEMRTISLESRWQKEKLHSRKQDDFESQTKKKSDAYEPGDRKKDSAVKVKNNVDKQESKVASHDKSRRYRSSRSKTPPKAYLKAVNKKAVKEKRLGSTTPPKAYSKDLKKVDKRKKSHSEDRKRRSSGSSKKNRITGDKRKISENDTDKSISSLSDNESDSETENWRNKKTGASRKRDDIERERRIRQAAEREKLRQERKDREDKDRRENKVLERNLDEEHRYKSEIDSFDARDYRQHKNWENRSRFHRSLGERRSDEKVFYRKNKTFIEEEPHYSKSLFFEEEFSDDSKRNAKKGIVSVVKPDRKRRLSDVDLEDIKISSRPDKKKKDDFSKKIKKERLIISVQESSEDDNDTRSAKTKKAGSKRKKTKHKRSKEESTGESENEREKQSISVTFSKEQDEKPRKSVYDRLGLPVTKTKDTYKQDSASTSQKDKTRYARDKGEKHSRSKDKKYKSGHSEKQGSAIRRVFRDDDSGGKRDSLNVKIQKIHEKNAEIIQRRKEIEQDRQKYG